MKELDPRTLIWIVSMAMVAIVVVSRVMDKLVDYVLSLRKGSALARNTAGGLTQPEHDTLVKAYTGVRRLEQVITQNAQLLREIVRNQDRLVDILERMERCDTVWSEKLSQIVTDQRRISEWVFTMKQKGSC